MSILGIEKNEAVAKLINMAQLEDPTQAHLLLDALGFILILIIAILLFFLYKGYKNRGKKTHAQQPPQQFQQPIRDIAKKQIEQNQLKRDLQTGFHPRRIGKWGRDETPFEKKAQDSTTEQFEEGMEVLPVAEDMSVQPELPPLNFELEPRQYYWKQKEAVLWLVLGVSSLLLFFFIK